MRRKLILAATIIGLFGMLPTLYAPVFEITITYYCDYFATPVGQEHTTCGQEYSTWGQLDGIYKYDYARNCGTNVEWKYCWQKNCCNGQWDAISCPAL